MDSSLSKNYHTLCDHEPLPGRAVLLRSSNIKAAQQHRPTDIVTRFMGSETIQSLDVLDKLTFKWHECRAPFARFTNSLVDSRFTVPAHELRASNREPKAHAPSELHHHQSTPVFRWYPRKPRQSAGQDVRPLH